eukprot:6173214-Pleurochrysis_carterae.AAC.4
MLPQASSKTTCLSPSLQPQSAFGSFCASLKSPTPPVLIPSFMHADRGSRRRRSTSRASRAAGSRSRARRCSSPQSGSASAQSSALKPSTPGKSAGAHAHPRTA